MTIKIHRSKHKSYLLQLSWQNWTNLKGLHSGRGFPGNKRFFTCGIEKSFRQNKTVGVQTRAKLPISKVTKRKKTSNFRLFYACDYVTSYTSDVTNGANQSPSLNGFIGPNFISIRKAQRKLRQVTLGA